MPGSLSIPGIGDLAQRLGVENLDAFGDVPAAKPFVESGGCVVFLQRPNHQTLEVMAGKRLLGGGKLPRA